MMLTRAAATGLRLAALLAILGAGAPSASAPIVPVDEVSPFERLADPPRITVPSSIDSTGMTDASRALRAFLARVPNGSTIVFKPGGVYRLDQSIRVDNRHRLVFDGGGATLKISGCDIDDGGFVIDHLASRITIRKFTILGDNPGAGTSAAYEPGCEYQAGVAIYSGREIEVANVTISGTRGDCLYVDAGGPAYVWSDKVWFHHSVCKLNGRMGVAIAAASHVTVEKVAFRKIGMFVLDIEPYESSGGGTDIIFRNNNVARYGLTPLFTSWFVAAEGAPGSVVHDLTITGNVVTHGAPRNANTVTDAGLATTIRLERRQRVVFSNNSTTVVGEDPALYFSHVDGLTVTGNVQPMTKGSIARFHDCNSVRFK